MPLLVSFPGFLASVHPESEVDHSRRLVKPNVGRVPKSGSGRIKQRTQDARSYLFKLALELRLVAAQLMLHLEEFHDHRAIEKVLAGRS